MKRFRLLRPDEIECRVQKIVPEKGVSILLYKTARTDADLLDETVGCAKWENDFKIVDGTLYGGIGVDYGYGMVWKWDAGTESNTEAEKGRASDAFKRAGFKHGIGRELYSAPFVWVSANDCQIEKNQKGNYICKTGFEVGRIEYDNAERINFLLVQASGKPVFEWHSPVAPVELTKAESFDPNKYVCYECGAYLKPYKKADGTQCTIQELHAKTNERYGKTLCKKCALAAEKEYVHNIGTN